MSRFARIAAISLLLAALACAAWFLQSGSVAAGSGAAPRGTAAVSRADMLVAALGGFRGIVSEVVWFRADRLQDEGRYAELAQLAGFLTALEPHTPEVWAFTSWNLAYNVSVMMPDAADRWRWVKAGLKLLRDDGLAANPDSPVILREIAWLFLAKIGGRLDDASPYYREAWKDEVEKARASGDWSSVGLEPDRMKAVDAEYGAQDWTHPFAASLYYASAALARSRAAADRSAARQLLFQALMLESVDDARFAPRALAEIETLCREFPSRQFSHLAERFRARFKLQNAVPSK